MLGDAGRAQDMVQDAWLRWHKRRDEVDAPRAFLVTVVTRLCLNELESARARYEQSENHLPEPVDVEVLGLAPVGDVERISMAFMVMLERLTPPERAVLLLHEVFDFPHEQVAQLVSRTPASCRKLLERARAKLSSGRKMISATREEHERVLSAFVEAVVSGDVAALVELLAADATLITDGGRAGAAVGRLQNLKKPLVGAERIAAFLKASARAGAVKVERRELNGLPALYFSLDGRPFGALSLEVSEGKIQGLYFQGDRERLGFVGKQRDRE